MEVGRGRLTVDWLVDTVAAAAVWDAAEGSRGEKADGARDDGRLVGDDVTKQVASDNDAVQGTRVLDHQHGGRVDKVVANLQLRELVRHDLSHDLAPQTRRRQHVCLVERPDRERRVGLQGQVCGEAHDALDLGAGVRLGVPGVAVAGVLLALAEVQAAGQLADDVEVGAAADLGLERRDVDERLGREVARAQVAVRRHLLAQLQDALLRAHGARAPFGAADGAQEDGVGGFGGLEGFGCEGDAVGVDGALREGMSARVALEGGIEEGKSGVRTPPRRCSWKLKWPTLGRVASSTLRT